MSVLATPQGARQNLCDFTGDGRIHKNEGLLTHPGKKEIRIATAEGGSETRVMRICQRCYQEALAERQFEKRMRCDLQKEGEKEHSIKSYLRADPKRRTITETVDGIETSRIYKLCANCYGLAKGEKDQEEGKSCAFLGQRVGSHSNKRGLKRDPQKRFDENRRLLMLCEYCYKIAMVELKERNLTHQEEQDPRPASPALPSIDLERSLTEGAAAQGYLAQAVGGDTQEFEQDPFLEYILDTTGKVPFPRHLRPQEDSLQSSAASIPLLPWLSVESRKRKRSHEEEVTADARVLQPESGALWAKEDPFLAYLLDTTGKVPLPQCVSTERESAQVPELSSLIPSGKPSASKNFSSDLFGDLGTLHSDGSWTAFSQDASASIPEAQSTSMLFRDLEL